MTTRIEDLIALQARIRASNGADRELDAAIAKALGQLHGPSPCASVASAPGTSTWWPDERSARYTASLDAGVALLNAVFPGWHWAVSGNRKDPRGAAVASVHVPYGYKGPAPYPEGVAHNDNSCIAFLDAIVSAKISELESSQKEKA